MTAERFFSTESSHKKLKQTVGYQAEFHTYSTVHAKKFWPAALVHLALYQRPWPVNAVMLKNR